ncbi:MAG TPA: AAA family ATPase [Buttiauxella sp.]|jgi:hypothetical protein
MSQFTWIPVFKSIRDWLPQFQHRQSDLIQILKDIGITKGLTDKNADGEEIPLQEIDPFTFFAMLMKFNGKNRTALFEQLLPHIDSTLQVPTDFDGVPNTNPMKVWLFSYKLKREPGCIATLWDVFLKAKDGNIDSALFEKALAIHNTGFPKLTQCLFYCYPDLYLPIDTQLRPWLTARNIRVPKANWHEYESCLEQVRRLDAGTFPEISLAAWLEGSKTTINGAGVVEWLDKTYPGTKTGTKHIAAFTCPNGRQIALDPKTKQGAKVFIDTCPPEDLNLIYYAYKADDTRNHHLSQHASSLAVGHPAWYITISNIETLQILCEWYESLSNDEAIDEPDQDNGTKAFSATAFPLNQILFGPPGTGKTWDTSSLAVQIIDGKNAVEWPRDQIKKRYDVLVKAEQIVFTTFHQSFSYEDFIEGIRAETKDGIIHYKIEDGVFKKLATEATKNPNQTYVLIIDEINRGNISRIFGELITLLENSKRLGAEDEQGAILPYSKERFSVPQNLHVIGTMNTADKSLTQLDLALRRRFDFHEMLPQPALLNGIEIEGLNIEELLTIINQRIEVLLDKDYLIGHCYFLPLEKCENDSERLKLLADIFRNKLLPLLQEYFFDDYQRIGWVLNDTKKPAELRFVQVEDIPETHAPQLKSLFPDEIVGKLMDRRYRINKEAFSEIEAYKGIIEQ